MRSNPLSASETLFLLHPNSCLGVELVKLAIFEMVTTGHLEWECENRVVRRKHAPNFKRYFFYFKKTKTDNADHLNQYLLDLMPQEEIFIRNFMRILNKKAGGFDNLKGLVYNSLLKKGLMQKQFSIFGFFKSDWALTDHGEALASKLRTQVLNKEFPFPFSLISDSHENRLIEIDDVMDSVDADYKLLRHIPNEDFESATTYSGLNPRGFLPI